MKRLLPLIVTLTFTLILASTLTFAAEKADPPKMGPPPTIQQKEAKADLLDINAATEDQLKVLPGIPEMRSSKLSRN